MLKNAFYLKFEIEGFFTSIYNTAIDRYTIAVWFYPRSLRSVPLVPLTPLSFSMVLFSLVPRYILKV